MMLDNRPDCRPVYRTLHRPLTICGIDRRVFLLALLVGAASFNLFYSFAAGCLLFLTVYGIVLLSTRRDPQMLAIAFRSARLRTRYDAAKRDDLWRTR